MLFSDREVISAIRKGEDDVVLSSLYKAVLPKVKNYIKANRGNEDEAKDIFQDAVIIFYKKIKLEQIQEDINVTAYICLVAKNLWINRAKRLNKTTELPGEDFLQTEEEDFLKNMITEEKKVTIRNLLSEIGEECQKLLKYSVYDNLSMKEICTKMGYSSENVAKTYNYRCKQKLIQLVMKNKAVENLLRNK
ncbi:MAG TPA: sigma-70 family RNA polymerase sigma factor [Cytophagaceae bacterium]|jgi:RNA polymerase sigma factor (sigma-70 family)|nr:sigma-70 family RNA polymerase sigma factor [Cytophagaceae bacterium]